MQPPAPRDRGTPPAGREVRAGLDETPNHGRSDPGSVAGLGLLRLAFYTALFIAAPFAVMNVCSTLFRRFAVPFDIGLDIAGVATAIALWVVVALAYTSRGWRLSATLRFRAHEARLFLPTILLGLGLGALDPVTEWLGTRALADWGGASLVGGPLVWPTVDALGRIGTIQLLACLILPWIHESFFRGLLLPDLARRTGRTSAVVLVALIGAIAVGDPRVWITLLVSGVVLGYWRLGTGSVVLCVVASMTGALVVAAGLLLEWHARIPLWRDAFVSGSFTSSHAAVGFHALALLAAAAMWARSITRASESADPSRRWRTHIPVFAACGVLLIVVVGAWRAGLFSNDPPGEVVRWVETHAIPIATDDPGADLHDLEPLRAIIGDARIVGLGEATHGTSEHCRLRHRMIEFLVEEMGFETIAFEAGIPQAHVVDRWASGESAELEGPVGMGFWVWDTQEVLELFRWVRARNLSGPGEVSIAGVDVQSGAAKAARSELPEIVERHAPERLAALDRVLESIPIEPGSRISATESERIGAELREIAAGLRAAATRGMEGAALGEIERASEYVELLTQFLALSRADGWLAALHARDQAMAENVERILDRAGPSGRVILWAHNGHIGRLPGMMGERLGRRYGADYRPIGFTASEGTYRVLPLGKGHRRPRPRELSAPPPGSIEHLFSACGSEIFLLDLHALPAQGGASAWFQRRRLARWIGAVHTWPDMAPTFVTDAYDVLVHTEITTPTTRADDARVAALPRPPALGSPTSRTSR